MKIFEKDLRQITQGDGPTPARWALGISVLIFLFAIFAPPCTSARKPAKEVLVLHSYHKGLGWTDSITSGIISVFSQSDTRVNLSYEFMDTKRVFDQAYLDILVDLYKHKYSRRSFAAIISSDDHAFRFLLEHHDAIFPGTPVIFCGVNLFKDDMIRDKPLFTGIVESLSIEETIDVALRIHPDLKKIYAVADETVTGMANVRLLNEIAGQYRRRIEFNFIEDLETESLPESVSHLPKDSILLWLHFTSDRSGNRYSLEEGTELIARYGNRPIYSFWDFGLGHGIVGGKLTSGKAHGEKAARMCLRILNGVAPWDIPVEKTSPNQYMFDYNQMQKFGIGMNQLPPESTVINRPRSVYREHRTLFLNLAAAFFFLCLVILVFVINLFKRVKAEASLKESEDKFRSLVETTSDCIWEIDTKGRYTYVSPRIEDLLGCQPEEILGSYLYDMMPPFEAQKIRAVFHAVAEKRSSIHRLENRKNHKNGPTVVLETTGVPIIDPDGSFRGYRGVDRDITERKKAEEALKHSEERFRELAELLPETIFEMDLRGRMLFFNKSGLSHFQYTLEDLSRGLTAYDLIVTENHEKLTGRIKTMSGGETLPLTEYTGRKKDGSTFPMMAKAAPIQHDGEIIGLRGFLIDISDKKRMENKILKAQRMESIGTLAGGIAHDFNNLLMGIQGRISILLLDTPPFDPRHKHLEGIEACVQSASELTRQLLGFARAGKYDVRPSSPNELVQRTAEMFHRTKKEIHLHENYPEDIRTVEIDRSQIEQLLLNILVNAGQAMPGGGDLFIETRNVVLPDDTLKDNPALPPGKYVRIQVRDTGVGMDDGIREKIFDPFFTTKEMQRGTGLGLASAYGIAKNHNGTITVESQKGKGATFRIYLPASSKSAEKHVPVDQSILKGSETVLLVDDEQLVIDVNAPMLKSLGYKVLTARSGGEAIEMFSQNPKRIDLVILDLIMPGMTGGDVFDSIREIDPEARVLLSSGYSIDGEAGKVMARGCDGFIQKPFQLAHLSVKIREVLNSRNK